VARATIRRSCISPISRRATAIRREDRGLRRSTTRRWRCRRARARRRCCSTRQARRGLALLDDYAADHPEDELDLTRAKARLLADHGESDPGGVAGCGARAPSTTPLDRIRPRGNSRTGGARARVGRSARADAHGATRRPDSVECSRLHAGGPHARAGARRRAHPPRAHREPDNPAALDSLGWVHFRAGDAKGAIRTLEHAYSLGTTPRLPRTG